MKAKLREMMILADENRSIINQIVSELNSQHDDLAILVDSNTSNVSELLMNNTVTDETIVQLQDSIRDTIDEFSSYRNQSTLAIEDISDQTNDINLTITQYIQNNNDIIEQLQDSVAENSNINDQVEILSNRVTNFNQTITRQEAQISKLIFDLNLERDERRIQINQIFQLLSASGVDLSDDLDDTLTSGGSGSGGSDGTSTSGSGGSITVTGPTNHLTSGVYLGGNIVCTWSGGNENVQKVTILAADLSSWWNVYDTQTVDASTGSITLNASVIPKDGCAIRFRWSNSDESESGTFGEIIMKSIEVPTITNPPSSPRFKMTSGSVDFNWTSSDSRISAFQVIARENGTSFGPGPTDYPTFYTSSVLPKTARSTTVSGIPSTNKTVLISLKYKINGTWYNKGVNVTSAG